MNHDNIFDSELHNKAASNSHRTDITETILHFIDIYVKEHSQDYSQNKFTNIIFDNVYDLLNITFGGTTDFSYEHLVEIIYENITYYFKTLGIPRSYDNSIIIKNKNIESLTKQLTILQEAPQPTQKTEDWYNYRRQMLTASTAWEALDTQAAQNRLIYRKCAPLNLRRSMHVNINSPLHHGQKYEPISVMFYENMYKTRIGEFGCIQHPKYLFLGASPDGINILKDNPRFGRMLEIKNIVNREITGIPKKEYWVQMQMQMEVCNLPYCDFLETRFKEYENEEAFLKDGAFDCTKAKGVIICFHSGEGPIYKYSPFICDEKKCKRWLETCLEENKTMTWVRNIYWALDEYSCVLVPRNPRWFKSALPSFRKIWTSVLYEREHGYVHRKPKKKEKKNIILKVRTQSLDDTELQEAAI